MCMRFAWRVNCLNRLENYRVGHGKFEFDLQEMRHLADVIWAVQ